MPETLFSKTPKKATPLAPFPINLAVLSFLLLIRWGGGRVSSFQDCPSGILQRLIGRGPPGLSRWTPHREAQKNFSISPAGSACAWLCLQCSAAADMQAGYVRGKLTLVPSASAPAFGPPRCLSVLKPPRTYSYGCPYSALARLGWHTLGTCSRRVGQ